MTDVYGDNTNAVDGVSGLIVEHLVPEAHELPTCTAVASHQSGNRGHPVVAASARLQAASHTRGSALCHGDNLVACWSLDGNRVTVTVFSASKLGSNRCTDNASRRHDVVFDVDVVGCDASVVHDGQDVLFGVVTSDGYVHAVTLGLHVDEDGGVQVSSVPLDAEVAERVTIEGSGRDRNRAPRHELQGVAVVGTAVCVALSEKLLCFPRTSDGTISREGGYSLGGGRGMLGSVAKYVGSYLGGVGLDLAGFNHDGSSRIACMVAVMLDGTHAVDGGGTGRHSKTELLFVLHEDATLNVWGVGAGSGQLLRSVGLLPEAQKSAFGPSCLAFSKDTLNPGGVFLIASFEERVTGNDENNSEAFADEPTSIVSLFEVTVDERSGGEKNVHVENGPQLPDIRGRVRSSSLEFVSANEYRLWLVMESGTSVTNRSNGRVACVSFRGDTRGRHAGGRFAVETLETRLGGLLGAEGVEREICKMYFSELAGVCRMGGYAVDTVCLPWNASRRAAAEAVMITGVLGEGASMAPLSSSAREVQDWIDGAESSDTCFDRSMSFLSAYAQSIAQISSVRSIKVIDTSHPSIPDRLVVLVRGDGRISALVDATQEEFLRHGDLPCAHLSAATGPCAGQAAMALARYALCQGVSLKDTLLPILVRIVTGRCHLNAVEFGRHHAAVRQAFRAFSIAGRAFIASGEADRVVAAIDAARASRLSCPSTWTIEGSKYPRNVQGISDPRMQVQMSLAKAALEGCTRALLDLSLQLLVVGASLRSFAHSVDAINSSTSIESSIRPFLLSHWACTSVIIDDTKDKAEPMVVGGIGEPNASKRMKRSSQAAARRHFFDLAIGCSEDIDKLMHTLLAVPIVNAAGQVRSAILTQFLSAQNTASPFMHLIMRSKHISNKAELLDSLLRVTGSGDDASFKFFTAYNLSSQTRSLSSTMESVPFMERCRLEQQGLGMFLSLCDNTERHELAQCIFSVTSRDAVLQCDLAPEAYVDAVAEILDHLGCSSSAVRAGLFSAKIQEGNATMARGENHASEAAARARARVFKVLEEDQHMQEAYTVALSISDPQRQLDCLKSLIASLCAKNELDVLCTLPLVGLLDDGGIHVLEQVTHALWDRANKEPVDGTATYFVLYDFFVSRGNFQSAAGALLSYARRISTESERDQLRKLLDLQKVLTMTVGCLKLVPESDAWLEDGTVDSDIKVRSSGGARTEYLVPSVISVAEIEKELLLVKSLLKVVSIDPDFDVNCASHHDVLVELLERGYYDDAWHLAGISPFNDVQSSKELIVFKMSKDAFVDDECQAASAPGVAMDLWAKIQSLVASEPLAGADRLRLAAAEGILETDASTSLPPWLIEPYLSKYEPLSSQSKPQNQRADVTGMIRLLLHYGRSIEAAVLALEMLSPLVTSLPSIAFPRMGAVCIPHDLIDAVIASLRERMDAPGNDDARLLFGRLEAVSRQCVVSSQGQTDVISPSK